MSEIKLLNCPICGKEIDTEEDLYIPERDWKPTFYDPDSGGDPINIHCKCGLEFSTGTYDWNEFEKAWNTREPMERILKRFRQIEGLDSVAHIKDSREETLTNGYVKGIKKAIEICKEAGGLNE